MLLLLVSGAQAWSRTPISYGNLYDSDSLEIGVDGNPCYVYADASKNIFYECYDMDTGVRTTEMVIDASTHAGGIGVNSLSLAMSLSGTPHILACISNSTTDYAFYYAPNYDELVLLQSAGTTVYGSIKTDVNGIPHAILGIQSGASIIVREYISVNVTSWSYGNTDLTLTTTNSKPVISFDFWGGGSKIIQMRGIVYNSSTSLMTVYGKNDTALQGAASASAIAGGGEIDLSGKYYTQYYDTVNYKLMRGNFSVSNTRRFEFAELASQSAIGRLDLYNGNPYVVYNNAGTLTLQTNSSGSFTSSTIYGSAKQSDRADIEVRDGIKYVIYTDETGSDLVYLAWEGETVTVKGTVRDSNTLTELDSAHVCFIDSLNDEVCDYTNSTGQYELGLAIGNYDARVTKAGYQTYANASYYFSESVEIPFYLDSDEDLGNLTMARLSFIHYVYESAVVDETFEFEVIQTCAGLGDLLHEKYYYVTDSQGQINRRFYPVTYAVRPKGEWLIYNPWNAAYGFEVSMSIEEDVNDYLFLMKPHADSNNELSGHTYSAITGQLIANVTIEAISETRAYHSYSNESGDYQILDMDADTYRIYAHDNSYPFTYERTDISYLEVVNETEHDFYLFPLEHEVDVTIRWNITDCTDEASLANVTTMMRDVNGLQKYVNISDNKGIAIIKGIHKGWYNITHYLEDYVSISAPYDYQMNYSLSVCLRQEDELIGDCYKLNGTVYDDDGGTGLAMSMVIVNNVNGNLLTYVTDSTGNFDTGHEEGGRCLEEGYYTFKVERAGYDTFLDYFYLNENRTDLNITMNLSEYRVTYYIRVGKASSYTYLERAKVNLTEEYAPDNKTISRICFTDSEGLCTFNNLRTGYFIVSVSAEGYSYTPHEFRVFVNEDGKTTVILMDEDEPHYRVMCRVHEVIEGSVNAAISLEPVPLEDAEVRLYRWSDPKSDYEFIDSKFSGVDGGVIFDDLLRGGYKIETVKKDYFTKEDFIFPLKDDRYIEIDMYRYLTSDGLTSDSINFLMGQSILDIQYTIAKYINVILGIALLMFMLTLLNLGLGGNCNRGGGL